MEGISAGLEGGPKTWCPLPVSRRTVARLPRTSRRCARPSIGSSPSRVAGAFTKYDSRTGKSGSREVPELVNEVAFGHRRVVLHRHGKDIVAMIPVEDLELLEELEDRMDVAAAKRALARKAGSVPWTKAKAELGLN